MYTYWYSYIHNSILPSPSRILRMILPLVPCECWITSRWLAGASAKANSMPAYGVSAPSARPLLIPTYTYVLCVSDCAVLPSGCPALFDSRGHPLGKTQCPYTTSTPLPQGPYWYLCIRIAYVCVCICKIATMIFSFFEWLAGASDVTRNDCPHGE